VNMTKAPAGSRGPLRLWGLAVIVRVEERELSLVHASAGDALTFSASSAVGKLWAPIGRTGHSEVGSVFNLHRSYDPKECCQYRTSKE